jgi:uncharacterized membrane protein YuzA (DUF378 family)
VITLKPRNAVDWVAWVLVVVGAVNWGLVGAFKFNLVDTIFGVDSLLAMLVYILVGLAALYMVYAAFMNKE